MSFVNLGQNEIGEFEDLKTLSKFEEDIISCSFISLSVIISS